LTSFPGTTIIFFAGFPSMKRCTVSSAMAADSMASFVATAGTVILPRSLPLTWIGFSRVASTIAAWQRHASRCAARGCENRLHWSSSKGMAAMPARDPYLDYSGRPDRLSGGVTMIPIATPRGTFRVWTKRVGNNPRVKVLLASGYSMQGQAREIMNRGCDGFLQKPFTLEDISVRIRPLISRS